jgi:hypothetical protein
LSHSGAPEPMYSNRIKGEIKRRSFSYKHIARWQQLSRYFLS